MIINRLALNFVNNWERRNDMSKKIVLKLDGEGSNTKQDKKILK
jgi:hypothetical protein